MNVSGTRVDQGGVVLLLASVSFVPGNMAVSVISAGAIPLTVIPFFAYVLASQ